MPRPVKAPDLSSVGTGPGPPLRRRSPRLLTTLLRLGDPLRALHLGLRALLLGLRAARLRLRRPRRALTSAARRS